MTEATSVTSNKFYLDTDDVLGFGYQEYISAVRAKALTSPASYYTMRRLVLQKVKKDAVGNLYKTLFNVLSLGRDIANHPIGDLGKNELIPCFPSQKINDLAIKISSMLADKLNSVINIILPEDFEQIASSKLSLKGRASIIE